MTKDLDTRAWLRYAEEDLDVAGLLLRSGFYRHALFWVEQASEKILKVYIMEVHRAKELTLKLVNIIDYYMGLEINDENRKMLKELRNEVTRFSDPKSYGHICKEREIERIIRFFDMYSKVPLLLPIDEVLKEYSDIPKKMSMDRYEKVFREVEKLIGKAINSIQTPSAPSCKELDTSCIVQILQSVEEREDRVRDIILNVVQEVLRKYKGDEVAEQAVKDAQYVYTSFLDSLAVIPYFELHTYLCQFFEITRYPGNKEIPKDVIENLPQIINLLRKNLERVKRLVR